MMTDKIIAYKGFHQDLTCRDFQFEIGGTYEHKGGVKACESGFHACTHPLDVLGYYPPAKSRFALVELSGETDAETGGDTKISAAKIEIRAEITLGELVEAAVKHVFDAAKLVKGAIARKNRGAASATGAQGAASATGTRGAASATGYRGAAMATGRGGRARVAAGNALFLVERNSNWDIVAVWAGIAGKGGIKPETYYTLKNGAPVEADQWQT